MSTKINLTFSTAEISTIIAALANWEDQGCKSDDVLIEQIAIQDGRHPKLSHEQVDALRCRIVEEATDQEEEAMAAIHVGNTIQ